MHCRSLLLYFSKIHIIKHRSWIRLVRLVSLGEPLITTKIKTIQPRLAQVQLRVQCTVNILIKAPRTFDFTISKSLEPLQEAVITGLK